MSQAQLSPAVPKPDHVPDALVYDFDMFNDPGMIADAHDRALEIIKEAPPVFWTPRNFGHWVVAGHTAVFNMSRDTDRFSNAMVSYEQIHGMIASLPEGAPKPLIPAPITYDPPHHAVYRGPLQRAFSPKAMSLLKDSIRELAVELIETVKPNGECAFIDAIAEPLPVTIFLRMFGLPVERQREYRDLVKEHFEDNISDPSHVQVRLKKVTDIMHDTIMDRKENPTDDLISLLWQSEFNGEKATLWDIQNYCVVLFAAGLDTVVNGIALGAVHLAKHPELQAELRANPDKIPAATEEILRRYTFTLPPRFLSGDTEFEGVQMKKGEKAVLLLPTADLDPAEFDSPEQFDMAREGKAHIAFGTGPHRCLGSHLARFELNILYEELLARLPEFRLDADQPLTYHGGHVWGPNEVYLKWDN